MKIYATSIDMTLDGAMWNESFVNLEIEVVDGLVFIPSRGMSFPLSAVKRIYHGSRPGKQASPSKPEVQESQAEAEGGGSPPKAKSKPAKPKSAVRATKKVRREQG